MLLRSLSAGSSGKSKHGNTTPQPGGVFDKEQVRLVGSTSCSKCRQQEQEVIHLNVESPSMSAMQVVDAFPNSDNNINMSSMATNWSPLKSATTRSQPASSNMSEA